MLTIFRPRDPRNRPSDPDPAEKGQKTDPTFHQNDYGTPDMPPPKPRFTDVQQPVAKQTNGSTTIGKDLIFDGTVKGSGSIRVEGVVQGTLEVQNEVIIGSGGVVKGDIKADIVTVEGKLNGNVEARHKIAINKTGAMKGDIIAPRVVVASGAVYKGKIDMEAAAKYTKKDVTQKADTKNTDSSEKPTPPKPKPPESVKHPIPGPPPKK
jgi:cytoskeletal protein CcmA (bactofilin family)